MLDSPDKGWLWRSLGESGVKDGLWQDDSIAAMEKSVECEVRTELWSARFMVKGLVTPLLVLL